MYVEIITTRKDDTVKGIIMAGGSSSRLRPLTCDLPKPMVPVMTKPVMTYSIELLQKYGINQIGVTLQYLPEIIQDYFQNGSKFGVTLHYFIEDTPLGTAGSVKNAEEFLDETFIVISGDALTDINLKKALYFHKEKKSLATLVLKREDVPLEYGVVITDENGCITRFLEKPNWGEVFSDTVNTGIYILEPKVLEYFEPGQKFDFSQNLFPLLLDKGEPMYGYITDEYWCDIGDPKSYLKAHYDMLAGKVGFPLPGNELEENIWVGTNVDIDSTAKLQGPCYIGDNTQIGKESYIGAFSVIGYHNNIGPNTSIKRSILWNHNTLGRCVEIRGATLCNKVDVGERVSIYEGAVIGDGCKLKSRVSIKPDIKIWPGKVIEHGTMVQSNVVWGTGLKKTLFGKNGVTGRLNVDMDPQFVARLGAAFGAELKPDKRIGVSSDGCNGNIMLKYSMIAGMLSAGLEILDLEQLTTPILRYAVCYFGLDGGVHIFSDRHVDQGVCMHFVNKNGTNLSPSSERQIENFFMRGDFQKVPNEKIRELHNISNIPLFYAKNIVSFVDEQVVRSQEYKILVSTNGKLMSSVVDSILTDLGCQVHLVNNNIPSRLKEDSFDLGCKIDANGEELVLFDEHGEQVSKEAYTALSSLVCLKNGGKRQVVVPYNATKAIEKMAESLNGKVVRTKTSRYAVMDEVLKNETKGIQTLSLYCDGLAILAKLLEIMSTEQRTLSEIVRDIPEFYMIEKVIECPWEAKGKVMRWLIQEETKGDNVVELFEGVKIHHKDGWALVLPDSDEPVCRIYSEGVSEEYAEELTQFYEEKIRQAKLQ
jgi:mannose-1-phosphate guanylyltransferase/phosphomannomutase